MNRAVPHRFAALDGWRGICAVLVALHHFPANGYLAALPLVRNAWLFVDFFFVLSGFVIAYAYGDKLGSAGASGSFVRRRLARLWPLHVCVLFVFIALEGWRLVTTGHGFTGERAPLAILTNLALIQSLGVQDGLTWNTPSWSISTEFYTYLVFAAVCAVAGMRKWRVALQAVLALAGFFVLVLFSRYGMRETFDWGFFRCLYGFFFGTLAYEAWVSRKCTLPVAAACEWIAVALALGFLIFVVGDRPLEYLATPLFASTVFVFAHEAGVLSRIVKLRPVAALGRWSYSIYMVHMLVLAALMSALDALHIGATTALPDGSEAILLQNRFVADACTLGWLALVIALAAVTWRFIERPGQNWLSGIPASKSGFSKSV